MFWIKFVLIVLIVFVVTSIVKVILRKLLNIEKEKREFFSYNHINELHRKIDKGLKIISSITLIILIYVLLFYYYDSIYWFFIALIFFSVLETVVRAFFEWKYTEHPKQSILTLSEMFLYLIAIVIVIQFELLGTF
ncbi:DUF4181 domain-containing protein [Paenisporosarcina sp. TG20]|uniref:DUF4181 domain-containing protein n=1 Tax=Paenisporosarcina sp. TG20 TaxID=1211706 RepID=UPI0003126A55|nr:DUF4181 domain-containing protein [Paenisporosarcina sp. TG20]